MRRPGEEGAGSALRRTKPSRSSSSFSARPANEARGDWLVQRAPKHPTRSEPLDDAPAPSRRHVDRRSVRPRPADQDASSTGRR